MGVSGSGKSTIAKLLSENTNIPFFDADDFHPEANVVKMKSGTPLNDDDRLGWLQTLNKLASKKTNEKGAIIACSALKESYRLLLSKNISDKTTWVFLNGSIELINKRMQAREGHFMPSTLLKSQFNTLEVPEYGLHYSIDTSPEVIINDIKKKLQI
ncbi:gluconokinase [uncultured Maribacter sp.]|uniref:gluconokinase n=1 Tax=uncultured Maribacter sp. TaxID=431308 RepID=UPI0034578024